VETAKVDIRKLQQLNDRINQCLDALNQVRLSVHGLSHTGGAINPSIGQVSGFAGFQDPRFMAPGINPLAQAGFAGFGPAGIGAAGIQQPFGSGLSHSGGFAPTLAPFAPAWNPLLQPQGAFGGFAPYGGLSHTGVEQAEGYGGSAWSDPMLQIKVAQTFPYAQYAVPPVVSLY